MFQDNMESREDNNKIVFKCFNQRSFRIAGPAYLSSLFSKQSQTTCVQFWGIWVRLIEKPLRQNEQKKGGAAVVNTGYIFSVFLTAWLIA